MAPPPVPPTGAAPDCASAPKTWRASARTARPPTSVERIVAADNERADSRHNRYVISPRSLLEAQREARSSGLDIVGYYHSHPDHPARPSEFDREHAWPGTSYVIVSIEKGKAVDCRSWRLSDDRTAFEEERVDGVNQR
jgi:proteasome lid subunit RPN8/RPN11